MSQVMSTPRTYFSKGCSLHCLSMTIFRLLRNLHTGFCNWTKEFVFPPTVQKVPLSPHPPKHRLLFAFLENSDWSWARSQCSFDASFFEGKGPSAFTSWKRATGEYEVLGEGAAAICRWDRQFLDATPVLSSTAGGTWQKAAGEGGRADGLEGRSGNSSPPSPCLCPSLKPQVPSPLSQLPANLNRLYGHLLGISQGL